MDSAKNIFKFAVVIATLLMSSALHSQQITGDANLVNTAKGVNKREAKYYAIVDFKLDSKKQRFLIYESLTDKLVASYKVAHGKGSDKDNVGKATVFSDEADTKASSLGRFKVTGTFSSSLPGHGVSLALDGLDDTNKNAVNRGIVLHANFYMEKSWIRKNGKPGRSWGCFVLSSNDRDEALKYLKTGTIITAVD